MTIDYYTSLLSLLFKLILSFVYIV